MSRSLKPSHKKLVDKFAELFAIVKETFLCSKVIVSFQVNGHLGVIGVALLTRRTSDLASASVLGGAALP